MKRAWAALVVIVLICGCGGSDDGQTDAPSGVPNPQTADRLATRAAAAFLNTYTSEDGRVKRIDQGGDTVGEGQAYGLLVAAALGREQQFESIWAWTTHNLMRPDELLAFRWADGHVQDPQAAADADLDTVRALFIGACRFDRPELREAARRIGEAVLRHETADARGRPVMLAGPWAAAHGRLTTNPSYLDPVTLSALAKESSDSRFTALAAEGRRMIRSVSAPLPPDWAMVTVATGRARPVASASSVGGVGRFTWDAPRTLVRLAVDPEAAGRRIAARTWPVFASRRPDEIPVEHNLDGSAAGASRHSVTLVAAAGAATAARKPRRAQELLAAAEALDRGQPSYYGTAWVALGRLLLTTRRLDPTHC
jgi:endo-1,4-beta-D-glucanase Y